MISYLLLVEQHRTQIVIHALLKCQQENLFFLKDTAHTEIYTLSLHDALPISPERIMASVSECVSRPESPLKYTAMHQARSEEHTSELQSRPHLVCRLLLE